MTILSEELEHSMRHPDERDQPAELEGTRTRVHRIADDRATEARRLLRQLVRVVDVLIDLGLLPIEDIP
jgi:hypothetical protein